MARLLTPKIRPTAGVAGAGGGEMTVRRIAIVLALAAGRGVFSAAGLADRTV